MNNEKDENMISYLFNSLDIEDLIRSLEFEESINLKKRNKEKLTEAEYFFDTYFIKPRFISKRFINLKKRKKGKEEKENE